MDPTTDVQFAELRARLGERLRACVECADALLIRDEAPSLAHLARRCGYTIEAAVARVLAEHNEAVARVCIETAGELVDDVMPRDEAPHFWLAGSAATLSDYVSACVAIAANRALLMCVSHDSAVWMAEREGALRERLLAVPAQRYALRKRVRQ